MGPKVTKRLDELEAEYRKAMENEELDQAVRIHSRIINLRDVYEYEGTDLDFEDFDRIS